MLGVQSNCFNAGLRPAQWAVSSVAMEHDSVHGALHSPVSKTPLCIHRSA